MDTKAQINDELDKGLLEGLRYRPPVQGPDGQVVTDSEGRPLTRPPDPRYIGHAIKRMAQLGYSVDPEAEKLAMADEIGKITGQQFKFNGVAIPALGAVDDDEAMTA